MLQAPPGPAALSPERPLTLHPHVISRIFEGSEEFAQMRRTDPKRAAAFWTTERIGATATDDILAKLADLGVETSAEAFAAAAAPFHSAWDLSKTWRDRQPGRLDRHDDDFLGVAACELWRRFCPERPSFEMLDDRMQEGYRLSGAGQVAAAAELWWDTWAHLRPRLRPSMRTCDDAEQVFPGTQCLFNWLQDFQIELYGAAIGDPAWATRGIELCRAVVGQFPDERFVRQFRIHEAEFRFLAADAEAGERLLRELIAEEPDAPDAYAVLSSCLGRSVDHEETPRDLGAAILLLEQALARPVRDPALWDLHQRLADLRADRARRQAIVQG